MVCKYARFHSAGAAWHAACRTPAEAVPSQVAASLCIISSTVSLVLLLSLPL